MKVIYHSNNSGGYWWLKDKDWQNLEKAGWVVNWFSNDPVYKKLINKDNNRWLEGLAGEASKNFNSLNEGKDEFSSITGQDVDDPGCNCCGRPHNFSTSEK